MPWDPHLDVSTRCSALRRHFSLCGIVRRIVATLLLCLTFLLSSPCPGSAGGPDNGSGILIPPIDPGNQDTQGGIISSLLAVEFFPPPGTYPSEQWVQLQVNLLGADIHYRLDGQDATAADPIYNPAHPIRIEVTTLLSVLVCAPFSGCEGVQSGVYQISGGNPQLTPPPGKVDYGTQVTIATNVSSRTLISFAATPPAEDNSPQWMPYESPLIVTSNLTFHVRTLRPAHAAETWTFSYRIARLARPEIVPAGGPFTGTILIQLFPTPSHAVVRYTLDGSEPTEQSPEYSSPLSVSQDVTLKAKSFLAGIDPSPTRYSSYWRKPVFAAEECTPLEKPQVDLIPVGDQGRVVWIANAGDGTRRVFLVSDAAWVSVLGKSDLFLDLTTTGRTNVSIVNGHRMTWMEPRIRALLSIAFPPDYRQSGQFYISYLSLAGSLVVSRFTALDDPDHADATSESVVVSLPAPECGAGQLRFTPDGTLRVRAWNSILDPDETVKAPPFQWMPLINVFQQPLPPATVDSFWDMALQLSSSECSATAGVQVQSGSCRLNGAYVYGDRFGALRMLRHHDAGFESQLLAQPSFLVDKSVLGEIPPVLESRHFDITAVGEGEDHVVYLANYGSKVNRFGINPFEGWMFFETPVGGGIFRVQDNESVFSVAVGRGPDSRSVELQWHGQRDAHYQVLHSGNLQDWTETTPSVVGTGATISQSIPVAPGDARRFYRVLYTAPSGRLGP